MLRPSELTGKHELVAYLTLRELRGRYRRSFLGWTWSLINPLAVVLIYSLVFPYTCTVIWSQLYAHVP